MNFEPQITDEEEVMGIDLKHEKAIAALHGVVDEHFEKFSDVI